MNPSATDRHITALLLVGLAVFAPALRAQTLFPASNATMVNPDVQLRLTFAQAPVPGKSGLIRIYDAASNRLVDTLDLSIPPGPTASATGTQSAVYTPVPYPYAQLPRGRTNANTKAGTPSGGAAPTTGNYQLTIIGGFTDGFHFYPVIVEGNTAIIQLHHNLLEYGRTYYVQIDAAVFPAPELQFAGITGRQAWRFSTKPKSRAPAANATQLVVSADGSGDFNTVQGAMDFIPDQGTRQVTVAVKRGIYHEIVYFRNKRNVTLRGEAPGAVRVTYANSEVFNPHPVNLKTNEWPGTYPSRRAAFAVDNSDDIHLVNLVLETTVYGQAEGLLINGQRNILQQVHVIGTGDALQVNGSTYIVDSELTGAGDSILGRGPAFFERSTLRSNGIFMWIRNTAANRGNVFKDCIFIGTGPQPTTFARAPKNNDTTYPYAEAVLLNSTLTGIAPEGWGPADTGNNLHFWEFNSRNADGSAVDVSRRAPWSRQLDASRDAAIIRNYSDPAFVLGGWKPVLDGQSGTDPAEIPLPTIRTRLGALPGVDELPVRAALPEVLVMNDGSQVTTRKQWEKRRTEMRRTLSYYATGLMPPAPGNVRGVEASSELVLDGTVKYRRIHLTFGPSRSLGLDIGIFTPVSGGPFPTIILQNGSVPGAPVLPRLPQGTNQGRGEDVLLIVAPQKPVPVAPAGGAATQSAAKLAADRAEVFRRGYALVVYNPNDCAEDTTLRNPDGSWAFRNTRFFPAYPGYDWGILAAWAWGASRVADYLEQDRSLDKKRLVITGASRNGKSAMIAAAFDDRLAGAPVVTGGGGVGAYRFAGPRNSETLDIMQKKYPNWFSPNLHQFRGQVQKLPFDEHWFLALAAPRPFIALEGDTDTISLPEAVQQSIVAARPAYQLLGVPERLGVHYSSHGHAFTNEDWTAMMDFFDQTLRGMPVDQTFDKSGAGVAAGAGIL